MADLPPLPSGVWRHYKGPLYLVFGYGHDANADTLLHQPDRYEPPEPLGERTVVVYVGLELDGAHSGARLAVRTAEDFHAIVHTDGTVCEGPIRETPTDSFCGCRANDGYPRVRPRFAYIGPTWDGLP